MQTFSRRGRKALGKDIQIDQGNSRVTCDFDELLGSQELLEESHCSLKDSPPPARGRKQGSPPKSGRKVQTQAGDSAANRGRVTAEQLTLLKPDPVPSTTGNSTKTRPKGTGRSPAKASASSIGSIPGKSGGRQAEPSKESVRSKQSGRLLGTSKAKAAGSSGSKRKSGSSESNKQAEAARKRARAQTAGNAAAPASQEDHTATTLARSLSTPLPKAMARLFNPAALRDSAPAQTVMEAQELGEQSSYRDNAVWAMDGLCLSSSLNTQRESIVALLEICVNRRGRLALLSGGVADELFVTLGKLKLAEDAVLALGAAAITACFCQADANPALLADEHTTQLIAELLKIEDHVPENSAPASYAGRVMKCLREGFFGRLLPPEECSNPSSVLVAALAGLLDPNQGCLNLDPCKHSLRKAGALQQAAQMAAQHGQFMSDAAPTMHTVRGLWKLNKALVFLENACFACPANEEYLAGVKINAPASGEELGLPEWIVCQVDVLSQQGLSAGFKKDCLKALLAVLMNMTQNNLVGCESVVSGGVLEAVGCILTQIVAGGQRNAGCLKDNGELESWVDELSCCLGLLINLMEHQQQWRERLRNVPASFKATNKGVSEMHNGIVPLLCALLSSVIPTSRYSEATSPLLRRLSTLSTDEITLENIDDDNSAGAGSIVEVYTAVLLGFLIEGSADLQAVTAALLPTNSVEPVVAAIARCLDFYVRTGAMSKKNEDALRQLLVSLEKDFSSCK